MKEVNSKKFHKLYGEKKPRISYQNKDFFDYLIMTCLSILAVYFLYGPENIIFHFAFVLCVFMVVNFLVSHGFKASIPVIFKKPQNFLYMLIYKIENIKPMYFLAIGIFALENYLIFLTPDIPHKTDLARKIAVYLFFIHLISISIYRTAILIGHLHKKNMVREILLQTAWKGRISKHPYIVLEILHAYFTGLLTHIILVAPWYFIITHFKVSLVFLPLVCIVNIIVHIKYVQGYSAWFYRDHWLGHNSEIDFLYLHGTHHDAIPSGLIGVSGNGHLEGLLRHIFGNPTPFYNPLVSFLLYTLEVLQDIKNHQYIPGLFPFLTREFHEACQHSTHHFGKLEPYSIALKSAQSRKAKKWLEFPPYELLNSIMLDESLNGFKWDNPRYKHFLDLYDKYQK